MKKGCGIAVGGLAGLLLLLGGIGVYAALRIDRELGLREATRVEHESVATEATRLRAVLKPHKIADIITKNIPRDLIENSALPGYLKERIDWVVQESLPNEVALLSNADFRAGALRMTFFINERRLGPAIAQRLNETKLLQQMQMVNWEPAVWETPERGVIQAHGLLPMPPGMEEIVLDYWMPRSAIDPILIQGDHLLEVALDNRTGEGLVLILTIASIYGMDLDQILNDPQFEQVPPILSELTDARLTADAVSDDEIVIHLRVNAVEQAGVAVSAGTLLFLNMMMQPEIQKMLRDTGLTLTGKAEWKADLPAIVGEYHLTGLEAFIQKQMGTPAQAGQTS